MGSLQPRFRRLLTFGDVLDESIQLFRAHWTTYVTVSAVSLLPPGFVQVWLAAAGLTNRSISLADVQSGAFAQTGSLASQSGAFTVELVVWMLFWVLWSIATVVTTDAYLRGEEPTLVRVYSRAITRYLAVFGAVILFAIGMFLLVIAASLLFVITAFGIVGSIITCVALLVWWLKPSARKSWIKWLIILASPYGLPTYFGIVWSMFATAAVLEHRGPAGALSRSSELVDTHWFRVGSILTVSSLIVAALMYAPVALVEIPLTIGNAARGQIGLGPTESAISNAVSVILQIVFASIGSIVYTVLFIDLRNRREGTDIGERLSQLEAAPILANG